MTSLSIWLAAALILLVAGLLYRIAPGAGVLVVFVGVTVLVVIGDRLEEREREAEIESKRERLREAARRVP